MIDDNDLYLKNIFFINRFNYYVDQKEYSCNNFTFDARKSTGDRLLTDSAQ